MTEPHTPCTLAILGGTGNEGPGLALRWAWAGYSVIIGSRSAEKARAAAAELNRRLPRPCITGQTNREAAQACQLAVLTVPYEAQNPLLEELKDALQGKVLINVTVPLKPPKVSVAYFPPEGSAAEQAQRILGPGVRVVAAFQNVGAHNLEDLDAPVNCDVLICGDDKEAKAITIDLARALKTTGIDAGPLANAAVVEGLTALLIGINRRYKVPGAGIQITGLPVS